MITKDSQEFLMKEFDIIYSSIFYTRIMFDT